MDRQKDTLKGNGPTMEDERSSDEILRDIERTRGAMDETLDELGQRLHPRQLLDDAIDLFRSDSEAGQKFRGTTRRWGRRAASEVRDHPLPAMLIGAGLAWMLFNSRREDEYEDLVYPEGYTDLYEPGLYRDAAESYMEGTESEYLGEMGSRGGMMGAGADTVSGVEYDSETLVGSCRMPEDRNPALGEEIERAITEKSGPGEGIIAGDEVGRDEAEAHGKLKRAADAASQKAQHAGMTIKDKASHAADRVRHGATRGRQAVSGAAHSARERMSQGVEQAREGMSEARYRAAQRARQMRYRTRIAVRENVEYDKEQFNTAVEEYPMALAGGALALGLLAGIAMPRTRMEDRTVGAKADEAKRMAKRLGEEVMDRGKETAAAAAAAAANQLQREGLTPDELMAKGKRIAGETKEALSEALEKEDLSAEDVKDKLRHVADEARRTAKGEAKKHQEALREEFSGGAGTTPIREEQTGGSSLGQEQTGFGSMGEETMAESERDQSKQGPNC